KTQLDRFRLRRPGAAIPGGDPAPPDENLKTAKKLASFSQNACSIRVSPMKCVVLVLALFACLTSLPACAAGDDAKQLYEKAVSAFEKDDYLKALDLVGQAIKLSPANRQAQKLKLVIEETLKGEVGAVDGSTGPSNSRWTFCFGQNTIESEPSFVHVYHTADGL